MPSGGLRKWPCRYHCPKIWLENWKHFHWHILSMQGRLEKAEEGVHLAMCDNIDTRRVLETLRELVVTSNAYIEKTRVGEPGVNRHDPTMPRMSYT